MGNSERQKLMNVFMDKTDRIAFKMFCKNKHLDYTQEQPGDDFEQAFLGTYSSFKNFVAYTFEQVYEIPEHISHYINYEAMASDWEQSGDYWYKTVGKDCYVFVECC